MRANTFPSQEKRYRIRGKNLTVQLGLLWCVGKRKDVVVVKTIYRVLVSQC